MNLIVRILAFLLIKFTLVSCADTQDSGQSCEVRLDEQKFKSVAENTNCSNYERASGYLGQAGVAFDNFLKTGAADNMTKTIGIKKLSSPTDYTTGNRGYITNALCLIGANTLSRPTAATAVLGHGLQMNLKYQCLPILLIFFI